MQAYTNAVDPTLESVRKEPAIANVKEWFISGTSEVIWSSYSDTDSTLPTCSDPVRRHIMLLL